MYNVDLSNKVAIITGAFQGIGKAIATSLATNGCRLLIVDIHEKVSELAEQLSSQHNVDVKGIQADLSKLSEIQKVIDTTYTYFDEVNILINNAGVMQTKPFLEITEEDWDFILDLNLKGLFFLSQKVVKEMINRKTEGIVINMSSIAGRSGRPLAPHYAASKAGVISITKSMAEAFGKFNIRTNAVCPGVILTPMMKEIYDSRKRLEKVDIEEKFLESIKLDRLGTPEDVANTVLFLCSDLSSYINGQAINVCGGFEMD